MCSPTSFRIAAFGLYVRFCDWLLLLYWLPFAVVVFGLKAGLWVTDAVFWALEKVIQARSQAVSAGSPEEAIAAEGILSGALGKLFALMENYPDLKANENVSRLMEELSATENKISFSRQFYNDSVMALNNAVEAFPSNIVAGMFGFHQATYFEVAEAEAATPKVDLR